MFSLNDIESTSSITKVLGIVFGIIFALMIIVLFYLPYIIARRRRMRDSALLLLLNIFYGIFIWPVLLIWAFWGKKREKHDAI